MGNRKITGKGNEMIVDGRDEYYDRVFLQRLNMWKINPTVRKYMLDPGLGEMLCKLSGIDGIRVWHDQTLQKRPWDNPTSWHIDVPNWSFHSPTPSPYGSPWTTPPSRTAVSTTFPARTRSPNTKRRGTSATRSTSSSEEYPEFRPHQAGGRRHESRLGGHPQRPHGARGRTQHDPFPAAAP